MGMGRRSEGLRHHGAGYPHYCISAGCVQPAYGITVRATPTIAFLLDAFSLVVMTQCEL